MKQTIQIMLAFLIPFFLAIGLMALGDYFFPPEECAFQTELCFSISHADSSSIAETVYTFLIGGLFLAALILPPFLTKRAYQSKLSEIKSTSIIE